MLFILAIFVLGGCQTNPPRTANNPSANNETLTVSAAVSLKDAFNEIGASYQAKTGKTVSFNFGASGALQRQIETGAPVDVFASAGKQQMDELAAKGLIETLTRRDFARNRLVLIVPQDSQLNLKEFTHLQQAEVKKIAVGNPQTVPAGQYAAQVFERLKLQNNLQAKLIFAEDVRQVLDYVMRGEVDAGVVYVTDARVAGDKIRIVATAPEETHEPILYPLALVRDGKQKAAAQEFLDFVLSDAGQSVLQKYGFASATQK